MRSREAFFLSLKTRQCFCIFTPAQTLGAKGAVLYVHPFAEELNKSRRMVALQVRDLAKSGFDVLQIDLSGCGDSSGDFADATWERWIEDVLFASRWLQSRSQGSFWLWGLRSGALLAAAVNDLFDQPWQQIFWQPVLDGNTVVRDFLRLGVAGGLLSGNGPARLKELKSALASGNVVEVAGYGFSPLMAGRVGEVKLQPARRLDAQRVVWLDVRNGGVTPPQTLTAFEKYRTSGATLVYEEVAGPPFWQTAEIEEIPALIERTTAMIEAAA